ncbi:hypothetical protein V2G26_018271 [Clonostachys chloroleuca]
MIRLLSVARLCASWATQKPLSMPRARSRRKLILPRFSDLHMFERTMERNLGRRSSSILMFMDESTTLHAMDCSLFGHKHKGLHNSPQSVRQSRIELTDAPARPLSSFASMLQATTPQATTAPGKRPP